ncbi:hypothetical protein ACFW95_39335 [Streptomyces sp. NPDC059474]|uniref:hypothetical protein n=1 Tax=Streptomyces sp. NPDC059474 TaxID=3346846 RepID=UPI0036ADD615
MLRRPAAGYPARAALLEALAAVILGGCVGYVVRSLCDCLLAPVFAGALVLRVEGDHGGDVPAGGGGPQGHALDDLLIVRPQWLLSFRI